MEYTEQQFKSAVEKFGEVFFVLDSGEEYIVHGSNGYEMGAGLVTVKGMRGDELVVAEFPLDSIEHHYTHKEI